MGGGGEELSLTIISWKHERLWEKQTQSLCVRRKSTLLAQFQGHFSTSVYINSTAPSQGALYTNLYSGNILLYQYKTKLRHNMDLQAANADNIK
jgi:hypothetical protein